MSITTTEPAPNGRGCGERVEGEAYACFGIGAGGHLIEEYIVDPVRRWPGKFQRGIKVMPRDPRNPNGVHDLVVFVGAENYPSVWSFVEEASRFGVSRRMPPKLPYEKLTPGVSLMVMVHSKAIPLSFSYDLNRSNRPLDGCKCARDWQWATAAWGGVPVGYHPTDASQAGKAPMEPCTFALQDLAVANHHLFTPVGEPPEIFHIKMPSFSFEGIFPRFPDFTTQRVTNQEWATGIFMAMPLTHFEFRNKAKKPVVEKIRQAGFQTAILNW
ncbi:MAG: hypothetical protein KJ077_11240 [Anaerolineae bacterium]|nr:hypothetical protein [Anaerolineae bacterium]